MFAVIGEIESVDQPKIGGPWETTYTEEVVALFSDENKAKDYIKKSRLKHRVSVTYGPDKVFKKSSLLRPYVSARVEDYTEPVYPVDPVVK